MKKYSKFVIIFLIMLFPITAYAGCPMGPSVTADLAGALKIMRILAPVIVIGYSFVDGIKALYTKDIDAQSKAVYRKFFQRIAAAVMLFVIPVIVDLLMQVMNVWDADGHCTVGDTPVKEVETSATRSTDAIDISSTTITRGENDVNLTKTTITKNGSADKLENGKGGSADKLNNGKDGSADKLNNGKGGSADQVGGDQDVSVKPTLDTKVVVIE